MMRPLSIVNANRLIYWKAEALTDSQQSPKSLIRVSLYQKAKSASMRDFQTHVLIFRYSVDMG